MPADWLADVRAATEDGFFALTAHLPAEASEALLEYAATGRLAAPAPPPAVADPFAHPDALRRIRLIADQEELEQALAFPWEKWGVFLHPSQRALVERSFSGPARVAGSAGTGKTIVAIHRAVRLARENPNAKVLLASFSEPLAAELAKKVLVLAPETGGVVPRITTASFQGIAEQMFQLEHGVRPRIAERRRAARAAARGGRVRGPQGLFRALPAVGVDQRHRRLGPDVARRLFDRSADGAQEPARPQSAREPVAGVPGGARRAGGGALHDLGERLHRPGGSVGAAAAASHSTMSSSTKRRISRPAELRFFAALAPAKADGLFLSGDVGQRIFQHPFSWASLGVDVRGRSHTLKVCYRTSQQIRRAADKLLPTVLRDTDGLEDERRGIISVFDGPAPEVKSLATVAAEADAVRQDRRDLAWRRDRAP